MDSLAFYEKPKAVSSDPSGTRFSPFPERPQTGFALLVGHWLPFASGSDQNRKQARARRSLFSACSQLIKSYSSLFSIIYCECMRQSSKSPRKYVFKKKKVRMHSKNVLHQNKCIFEFPLSVSLFGVLGLTLRDPPSCPPLTPRVQRAETSPRLCTCRRKMPFLGPLPLSSRASRLSNFLWLKKARRMNGREEKLKSKLFLWLCVSG